MSFDFTKFNIKAVLPEEIKAAEIFADEIRIRNGLCADDGAEKTFTFSLCPDDNKSESFSVKVSENGAAFSAHRLRGFIYAFGLFLRKSVFADGKIILTEDISGSYTPEKKYRGHQLGFRDVNNTYDKWDRETYKRYMTDLMLFGSNTFEGIPGGKEDQNSFMIMSGDEMLGVMSEICCELDADFSVWHPTYFKDTAEIIERQVADAYSHLKKLDVLFVPGGDPGDMLPHDLFERCRILKEKISVYHPDMKLFISAQAPHEYPDWGERFTEEVAKNPDYIDGFIFGPNHAMPLEQLSEVLGGKYPLRFYPDVTHNIRSEYPVHFDRNDWHYAFACALSRESINPRPEEYTYLYSLVGPYIDGGVSYSDGINDDVNKIIMSMLDFDTKSDYRTTLLDYARAFFPETDAKKIADGIIGLENNWKGDPTAKVIDETLDSFISLGEENSALYENYRFVMCLFRAECDKLVKERFVFENSLIEKAKPLLLSGNIQQAKEILESDYGENYHELRKKIDLHADSLNKLIGMQLDVENYHGKNWDRGCTLDTVDRPVSDRKYLLKLIEKNYGADVFEEYFNKTNAADGEIYFSFAFDKTGLLTKQIGEYYIDFQGDGPDNDGSMPMSGVTVYDHFRFDFEADNLSEKDHVMRIIYSQGKFPEDACMTLKVNGKTVYEGFPYGGERDTQYEEKFLPKDYRAVKYFLPADIFEGGKFVLEIKEPTKGIMLSEFSVKEV